MSFEIVKGVPVWGAPLENAVNQMVNCAKSAAKVALMADHHLGYAVPIGGVIAYREAISPSAVGFDISCGNKAVQTDLHVSALRPGDIGRIMDDLWRTLSFGVGRKNDEPVDHPLFDDPTWDLDVVKPLKDLAHSQLETIGAGNHYVIITMDESGWIWVANHFGSRGFGHKVASHFIKAGGGKDGVNVDPVVLDMRTQLGQEYELCMKLAGRYAYAGRDGVCAKVIKLLGARSVREIHNHHNFAWKETHGGEDFYVVRKGATPAFPGQLGFIGASMGEPSVIVEGLASEESKLALYSAPHGAGRAMSRTEAAGKSKWKDGKKVRISDGKVSREMMQDWVKRAGVELRGAGVDESPHCYKRLSEVLDFHKSTLRVLHTLTPIGVAMAADTDEDPYKD